MSLGYRPTLGHSEKRGGRKEKEPPHVLMSVHTCAGAKAESDNTMWRRDVISVYGSCLLNHTELKRAKWREVITIRP